MDKYFGRKRQMSKHPCQDFIPVPKAATFQLSQNPHPNLKTKNINHEDCFWIRLPSHRALIKLWQTLDHACLACPQNVTHFSKTDFWNPVKWNLWNLAIKNRELIATCPVWILSHNGEKSDPWALRLICRVTLCQGAVWEGKFDAFPGGGKGQQIIEMN